MYSAFSRMHMQRTWDGIINAPIGLDDVVLAEWVWARPRRSCPTAAILLVLLALGFGHTWLALWILPLGFLVGLVFGAFGLIMNALAPGYDFFTYFFTLVLTPMLLLSGVFFPVDQLPAVAAGGGERAAAQARDRARAAADARPRSRRASCCTSRCSSPTRSPPTTSRWCSRAGGCSSDAGQVGSGVTDPGPTCPT